MVVISVPDHAGARPLSRELGLKRLRGSFRFPIFADGEECATCTRMLFVPARLPPSTDEAPAPDEPPSLIHRVEDGGRRYHPDARRMVTAFAKHHSCSRAETDLLLRSARSFVIRTGGFPKAASVGRFPRKGYRSGTDDRIDVPDVFSYLELTFGFATNRQSEES